MYIDEAYEQGYNDGRYNGYHGNLTGDTVECKTFDDPILQKNYDEGYHEGFQEGYLES